MRLQSQATRSLCSGENIAPFGLEPSHVCVARVKRKRGRLERKEKTLSLYIAVSQVLPSQLSLFHYLLSQGCGIVIPKDELKDHNCVREMRLLLQQQQNRISTMQQELGEQKVSNAELRRSLDVLREAIQPLLPRGQTLPTMLVNESKDIATERVMFISVGRGEESKRWGGSAPHLWGTVDH